MGAGHPARLPRADVRPPRRRDRCAGSPARRSARSSATRSPSRSGSTSGSACPRTHEPRVAADIACRPARHRRADADASCMAACTDPTSVAYEARHEQRRAARCPGVIDQPRRATPPRSPSVERHHQRPRAGRHVPAAGARRSVDGVALVARRRLPAMSRVASAAVRRRRMLVPTRWALGFMKPIDNRRLPGGDEDSVLLSDDAFGHAGHRRLARLRRPGAPACRSATHEQAGRRRRPRDARPGAGRRHLPGARLPPADDGGMWFA